MPRNLSSDDAPIALSESPHSTEGFEAQEPHGQFIIVRDRLEQPNRHQDSIGKLHPYTRLLTISDLESCVALENAAFPVERERASREKFHGSICYSACSACLRGFDHGQRPCFVTALEFNLAIGFSPAPLQGIPLHFFPPHAARQSCFRPRCYGNCLSNARTCRLFHSGFALSCQALVVQSLTSFQFMYRLSKCPELSLGLFCTAVPDSNIPAETLNTGRLIESDRENGAVGVLLAHIVATQSFDTVVTDAAMDYPADWNSAQSSAATVGHRDGGRTICVHSLGVLPKFQSRGLGRTLMTAYIQQMSGAGIADRIALIAHEHLVDFYEKLGFTSKGPSKSQFGGGGWIDLVFELKSLDARAKYG